MKNFQIAVESFCHDQNDKTGKQYELDAQRLQRYHNETTGRTEDALLMKAKSEFFLYLG